ncbi:MAG: hypothetical protein LH624_00090 [Cryobacterium sp.]|nr:hypothetical protein [Cryobacterium sp.]
MATEKFHWTSPAGVEIVLPHMNKIKAGIIRRHRKEEPVDFIFSVLEDVGDEATLAKADELEADDINDLFEKWQEAGADAGK